MDVGILSLWVALVGLLLSNAFAFVGWWRERAKSSIARYVVTRNEVVDNRPGGSPRWNIDLSPVDMHTPSDFSATLSDRKKLVGRVERTNLSGKFKWVSESFPPTPEALSSTDPWIEPYKTGPVELRRFKVVFRSKNYPREFRYQRLTVYPHK